MGDGNSFPFVLWLLMLILACKSIVLCKCSGNRIIGYSSSAFSLVNKLNPLTQFCRKGLGTVFITLLPPENALPPLRAPGMDIPLSSAMEKCLAVVKQFLTFQEDDKASSPSYPNKIWWARKPWQRHKQQ